RAGHDRYKLRCDLAGVGPATARAEADRRHRRRARSVPRRGEARTPRGKTAVRRVCHARADRRRRRVPLFRGGGADPWRRASRRRGLARAVAEADAMKTIPLEQVADLVPDGSTVMIGGFMGVGTPERILDSLVERGRCDLTVIANDTAMPGVGIGK